MYSFTFSRPSRDILTKAKKPGATGFSWRLRQPACTGRTAHAGPLKGEQQRVATYAAHGPAIAIECSDGPAAVSTQAGRETPPDLGLGVGILRPCVQNLPERGTDRRTGETAPRQVRPEAGAQPIRRQIPHPEMRARPLPAAPTPSPAPAHRRWSGPAGRCRWARLRGAARPAGRRGPGGGRPGARPPRRTRRRDRQGMDEAARWRAPRRQGRRPRGGADVPPPCCARESPVIGHRGRRRLGG